MDTTFQERLNLYEIAQETIGFMMAIRTERIFVEKNKSNPDAKKIAQWENEFYHYRDEQHRLSFDDDITIKRVLDEYCPIVKANFNGVKTGE